MAAVIFMMMVIALRHGDDGVVSIYIHATEATAHIHIYRPAAAKQQLKRRYKETTYSPFSLLASIRNIMAFISDKSPTIMIQGNTRAYTRPQLSSLQNRQCAGHHDEIVSNSNYIRLV